MISHQPKPPNEPIDPARSALMARVRGRNTKPEMTVRRLLHAAGFRYRLHAQELPGRPDLVFRRRRKAIFVHGCFWHRHEGCPKSTIPKTRVAFWSEKFKQNKERDARNEAALRQQGWSVMTVWECETRDLPHLLKRISEFLK